MFGVHTLLDIYPDEALKLPVIPRASIPLNRRFRIPFQVAFQETSGTPPGVL